MAGEELLMDIRSLEELRGADPRMLPFGSVGLALVCMPWPDDAAVIQETISYGDLAAGGR